jgi:hypothetical protein
MKKMISAMLAVAFVGVFAMGIVALSTEAQAAPPSTIVCIDGMLWKCDWVYVGSGKNIKLIERCHWAGPC